jgi:hypothetical protein
VGVLAGKRHGRDAAIGLGLKCQRKLEGAKMELLFLFGIALVATLVVAFFFSWF